MGSTSTEFKVRFRNHKSSMLTNKKTCELAVHFNCTQHVISEISFIVIEKITRAGVREWHIRQRTVYLCQAPGGMISEGKWV